MNITADRFTLIQRIRAAKDNFVFTVAQKARASARLVALLGSIVFSAVLLAVAICGFAVGAVAGPVVAFVAAVWEVVMGGVRTSKDATERAWTAATRPATDLLGW